MSLLDSGSGNALSGQTQDPPPPPPDVQGPPGSTGRKLRPLSQGQQVQLVCKKLPCSGNSTPDVSPGIAQQPRRAKSKTTGIGVRWARILDAIHTVVVQGASVARADVCDATHLTRAIHDRVAPCRRRGKVRAKIPDSLVAPVIRSANVTSSTEIPVVA
eukprot:3411955-Rhodomonas_salina.3